MRLPLLASVLMWLISTAAPSQNNNPAGVKQGIAEGPEVGNLPAAAGSGAVLEVWRSGITSSLFDFEDLVGWRTPPEETGRLPGFVFEENSPGNAVVRMTGWFEPEVSGEFVFWISSQGPGKLVISQPDSVAPMGKGAFMYYSAGLGWPKPGQWDLYKTQRCGPWTLEKGRRYFLEFWYAARTGVKHAALSWSASPGGPLKDWAELADSRSGQLTAEGSFLPSPPAPETKSPGESGDESLFPAGGVTAS